MKLGSIRNKKCFVKSKTGEVYCSECRKIIMRDSYNMKRHAAECHFESPDDILILKENEDYVYAWKYEEDIIGFYIFTPVLGEKAITYHGVKNVKWQVVFKAIFYLNEVKIQQAGTGTVDTWMREMETMVSLNDVDPRYILEQIFHMPGFRSYEDFLHIYRAGRYHLLPENKENALKLHILMDDNVETLWVGKNYYQSEKRLDIKKLLDEDVLVEFDKNEMEQFDKNYPSYLLKHYVDSGQPNPLRPLLAGYYSKGMELLVKADCPELVNHYELFMENNKGFIKEEENSMKEMFGLPANILRKITGDAVSCRMLLRTLFIVYKMDANLLKMDRISGALIRYFEHNIIAHTDRQIPGHATMSKHRKMVIRQYLQGKSEEEYGIYVDYLRMREELGEEADWFPGNLRAAHDMLWGMMRWQRYCTSNPQKFYETTHSYTYLELTTNREEEDEVLKESKYVIVAPERREDLFFESEVLRHCVKMYERRVADGGTKIYFLRKREEVEKPLVTVEVFHQNIIQVKAKFNRKAEPEIQDFVKYWAKKKRLNINSADIA